MNIIGMEIIIFLSLFFTVASDGCTNRASIDFCLNPIYYFRYDESFTKNPNLTNCFQYSEPVHSQDEISLTTNQINQIVSTNSRLTQQPLMNVISMLFSRIIKYIKDYKLENP
jgi:hypothetical protein